MFRIIILVVLAGVVTGLPTPSNVSPLGSVTSGNSELGFQLWNVIKRPGKSRNLVISPLSLSIAMAMLDVGARGKTRNDIRQAIRFPSEDNLLYQGYENLLKEVAAVPSTNVPRPWEPESASLVMPNRIFVAESFSVSSAFNKTLSSNYDAGAERVDYRKPIDAADIINEFVSTSTNDKIQNTVTAYYDFDDDTKLVLVNAIHFKAQWVNTFEKGFTSKMPFFTLGTHSKDVDMMSETMYVAHGEHPELAAKSISLEYAGISRERRMFMIILLPNEKDGIGKLEETLKTVPLTQVINAQTNKLVSVQLPKFKVISTVALNEPLKDLGCDIIFTDDADMSGITESNSTGKLTVSKVIQKAIIEVTEHGTEAATGTAFITFDKKLSMFYTTSSVPFHVDHPFLAVIVLQLDKNHRSDITPVFIARVQNPRLNYS